MGADDLDLIHAEVVAFVVAVCFAWPGEGCWDDGICRLLVVVRCGWSMQGRHTNIQLATTGNNDWILMATMFHRVSSASLAQRKGQGSTKHRNLLYNPTAVTRKQNTVPPPSLPERGQSIVWWRFRILWDDLRDRLLLATHRAGCALHCMWLGVGLILSRDSTLCQFMATRSAPGTPYARYPRNT